MLIALNSSKTVRVVVFAESIAAEEAETVAVEVVEASNFLRRY
jgi:ribosomal protein L1